MICRAGSPCLTIDIEISRRALRLVLALTRSTAAICTFMSAPGLVASRRPECSRVRRVRCVLRRAALWARQNSIVLLRAPIIPGVASTYGAPAEIGLLCGSARQSGTALHPCFCDQPRIKADTFHFLSIERTAAAMCSTLTKCSPRACCRAKRSDVSLLGQIGPCSFQFIDMCQKLSSKLDPFIGG